MKWPDVIRLYRGLFLLIAFTFLGGINVNGWAKAGVNHVLIFELDPRNHLSHHNLLEVAGMLANLWCLTFIGMVFSDEMHVEPAVWPLVLLGSMMFFLFCPFRVFFYEARMWLLKRIWVVFTAPFHYVAFADFWLADQLNSLVLALRDVQFLVCYYILEVNWLAATEPGACTKHSRTYGVR